MAGQILTPPGAGELAVPSHELERRRAEAEDNAKDAHAVVPCSIRTTHRFERQERLVHRFAGRRGGKTAGIQLVEDLEAEQAKADVDDERAAILGKMLHVCVKTSELPFCRRPIPAGYELHWYPQGDWQRLVELDRIPKKLTTHRSPAGNWVEEEGTWPWEKLHWCGVCTTWAGILVRGSNAA